MQDALRQAVRVSIADGPAGDSLLDHFAHATDIGRHHGHAQGLRLQQDVWQSLVPRGQHHDVHHLVPSADVGLGARHVNTVGDPEFRRITAHLIAHWSIATDNEVHRIVTAGNSRGNIEPQERPFFLAHAVDAAEHPSAVGNPQLPADATGLLRIEALVEPIEIDPVVDDLDAPGLDAEPFGVVVGAGPAIVAQDNRGVIEHGLIGILHEAPEPTARIVGTNAAAAEDDPGDASQQGRDHGGEVGGILPGMDDLRPAPTELRKPESDGPDHIRRERTDYIGKGRNLRIPQIVLGGSRFRHHNIDSGALENWQEEVPPRPG